MADTVYLDSFEETEELLSKLSQPVREWFKDKFPDFTEPQKMAIPSIMDGEHLLLCSPTGSGKTTLVDIILGLLQPQQGSIYFNEIDIKSNPSDICAMTLKGFINFLLKKK